MRLVNLKFSKLGSLLLVASLIPLLVAQPVNAHTRYMQLRGQITSPAFEGWWPNEDGTFKLFFGYMNSNWEQQFDISIGAENYFSEVEPGELDDLSLDGFDFSTADMGQPTHFYPRRNTFLFTIDVPADFA